MRLRVNSLPRDRPRRLGIIRADFANAFTAPPLSAACEMRNEEADNKMAFSSKSEFRKACRPREAAMQFAVPRPQAVGWSPMRRRLVSPAAKSRLCFKWIRGSFEKCRKCFEIHAHCGICPTIRRKYGAASLIRTFPKWRIRPHAGVAACGIRSSRPRECGRPSFHTSSSLSRQSQVLATQWLNQCCHLKLVYSDRRNGRLSLDPWRRLSNIERN